MPVDHFRYDLLAQSALRGLVREVLTMTARKGLPGEHHFYISFDTHADGVELSTRLRAQYPDEMTIVLQHQFWDLKVGDDKFEVGLSFGGVPERLVVPFASIKSFADPSAQFALQFEQIEETETAAATPAKSKTAKVSEKSADKAAASGEKPAGKPRRATSRAAGGSVPSIPAPALGAPPTPAALKAPPSGEKPDKPKGGAEVVRLDRFRKKK